MTKETWAKNCASTIQELIRNTIELGATRAIKFLTPTQIVRVTRRCYEGKIRNRGPLELLVTIGRPNYKERKLIKTLIRAGISFPIKETLTYFPKKKKTRHA